MRTIVGSNLLHLKLILENAPALGICSPRLLNSKAYRPLPVVDVQSCAYYTQGSGCYMVKADSCVHRTLWLSSLHDHALAREIFSKGSAPNSMTLSVCSTCLLNRHPSLTVRAAVPTTLYRASVAVMQTVVKTISYTCTLCTECSPLRYPQQPYIRHL